MPPPGSVITREYKGHPLQVKVLPNGFEFEGEVYKSLSAVAKAITGQHCNGFHFFRLGKERADDRQQTPKPNAGQQQRAVRYLHPQVHGRRTRPGIQHARRPT